MPAYRNKNTGDVVLYDREHPELEAFDNWETVDDSEVPDNAKAAYDAAATEQRLIAEAHAHRVARAVRAEGGDILDGSPPPTPTAGHIHVAGVGDQERVLAKGDGKGGKGAAVQIGPDPETHPQTPAEVAALGAYQIEHPPTDGVLARAKRDHRPAGRSKTGADAESPAKTVAERAPEQASGSGEQPARTASKADLVAYAVSQGVPEADVKDKSRDELSRDYGK